MQTAAQLDNLEASYIREILAAATQPDVISLAGGLPADEHFPVQLLQRQFAKLAQLPGIFQYGSTLGYPPLLEYLQQQWQLPTDNQILITNGSQQGLDLIARAYINPGDPMVMEAPSYLGALQVFQLAGAKIHTVEQTPQGPNLEQLEQHFKEHAPKFFYAVPDFHNPTGICWDLPSRKKVAELCQQYKVALIEDAPYRELRFAGETLPLVSSFCPEQALLLRSFSKVAAPGLRLGAIAGPSNWLAPLVRLKQAADLHTAIPSQAVILGLLQDADFVEHLEQLKEVYQTRYQALSEALAVQLPGCAQNTVQGGMFIWLGLPVGTDDFELANQCIQAKLAVVPGRVFYPKGQAGMPALRLNFSNADEQSLHLAASKLADQVNQLSHAVA